MRYILGILLTAIFFGCYSDQQKDQIEYIKVITFTRPDSITAYNKGIGLENFAYYSPEKDSFIFKHLTDFDPIQYETFTAKLNNTHFADSLLNLVDALRKYKTGVIPVTKSDDATYCGPTFYVEYKKNEKIHYHYFLLDKDTALNNFSHFFFWLPQKTIFKNHINNNIVNGEEEAIVAMIKLGEYEKVKAPYIPRHCDNEITTEKIFGSWRAIEKGFNYQNIYSMLTFNRDDSVFSEHFYKGKIKRKASDRFYIDTRNTILVIKTKNKTFKFPIIKLTDSCLAFKDRDYLLSYNRL